MEDSLENISGIGKATAERLKAAGIDSVQKLASLTPEDLIKLKIKGIGAATAKKYIDNAIKILEESSNKQVRSEKSEKMNVEETKQSEVKEQETKKVKIKQEIKEQIEKEKTIPEEIEEEKSISEAIEKEEKEKIEEKVIEEQEEEIPEPPDQDVENLKILLKQQAECNIGTVGHVDHGMIMSLRHFP